MVWPTLGSRTAKEQKRTEHSAHVLTTCFVTCTVTALTLNTKQSLQPTRRDSVDHQSKTRNLSAVHAYAVRYVNATSEIRGVTISCAAAHSNAYSVCVNSPLGL